MTDRDDRGLWGRIGVDYNPPSETPREEMWATIESRIEGDETPRVIDLDAARYARSSAGTQREVSEARSTRPAFGWAVAAAAVLVLGVGIGRMSVSTIPAASGPDVTASPSAGGNGLAARTHLGRTEALLTMVRADARDGRVDPAVAVWAEDLLAQTRLLLDRPTGVEPGLQDLLLDLELVLVQVVGLAEADDDDPQSRTEVELTLKTLDEGEVLPRIQAQIPLSMAGA